MSRTILALHLQRLATFPSVALHQSRTVQREVASKTATRLPSVLGVVQTARRYMSTTPTQVVDTTTENPKIVAAPAPPPKNVNVHTLQNFKNKDRKITMATAYDFPSAVHVDQAGLDVILVGDSVGMVELGYDTTLPVTMDDMLHHCKSVARGCHRPLLVGDMPFGSYESSKIDAIKNAQRFLKEGGMESVKMEGAGERVDIIEAVVNSGVAVMGHIGLTPQSVSTLGGFRVQGKTANKALQLIEDARRLQDAGCFAVVIECVPAPVAQAVTEAVDIPTIGIGSGPYCDGQVLVYHDLLGMMQHHHHAKHVPSFCKQFATVGQVIQDALTNYKAEVMHGSFPGNHFSPYKMPESELKMFEQELKEKVGLTLSPEAMELGIDQKSRGKNGGGNSDDSVGKLY
eukprot:GFYU01004692.1.p1 GENE.GFYU01004692.1~~GFYU01004692.1.p1  ORF type:complete len:401 (-),score=100.65 GFYU01004692.1:159-1361(-)